MRPDARLRTSTTMLAPEDDFRRKAEDQRHRRLMMIQVQGRCILDASCRDRASHIISQPCLIQRVVLRAGPSPRNTHSLEETVHTSLMANRRFGCSLQGCILRCTLAKAQDQVA